MRSKISEIIDDNIKDRTLTLSDKHSFNIDDGSGSDSIEFTDIEFNSSFFIFKDDFVQINALNNKAKSNIGKLSINNKVITQIHIEKIHTTLDINITDIKTITFTNFKFDFLPTILFDKIWQIKFNNCEFYDRSSN